MNRVRLAEIVISLQQATDEEVSEAHYEFENLLDNLPWAERAGWEEAWEEAQCKQIEWSEFLEG